MERVILFIDGFNVYHAIVNDPALKQFRWLDYSLLGERLLQPGQRLEEVFYFTSFWPDQEARRRHQMFNRAQEEREVKVILGQFKRRERYCENCKEQVETREEKQTDVGIAVELLLQAMHDRYDSALLMSADSDLVPAILAVRKEYPDKRVRLAFPPNHAGAQELKNAADSSVSVKARDLRDCQLPAVMRAASGEVLRKPAEW